MDPKVDVALHVFYKEMLHYAQRDHTSKDEDMHATLAAIGQERTTLLIDHYGKGNREIGKANPGCCPLRPRTTPFREANPSYCPLGPRTTPSGREIPY